MKGRRNIVLMPNKRRSKPQIIMSKPDNELENRITQWVSAEVRAMQAYHVPPSAGMVKLDAMENPYPLPDTLKNEWLSCLYEVQINRYPDPDCGQLKAIIRTCFSLPADCGLMLGNGSDELIQIISMLVGGAGRTFLAPLPTFSMYQQISTATATQFVGVPLNTDFSLDAEKLLATITRCNPACIFLAYPNNPTANCFDPMVIRQVLEHAPGLVLVDEAYFAFSEKSFLAEMDTYPNLLVLRTMSKSGLAGLRLGMMMGHSQWIEQMEKLRLPYNISSLTQASAQFYLQHHAILQQQAEQITKDRDWVFHELSQISGIEVFPSETNFLFFRVSQNPQYLFEELQKKRVLVKNLATSAQLDHCLANSMRVTIGAPAENHAFIDALHSLITD